MSLRSRLRALFLLGVLELGVLSGVPMPPDKVRALIDAMNSQTLAHTLPCEEEGADSDVTG